MFYVYAHYELDTGRLFYIGKGSGGRAWSKSSRNRHWKNIAVSHGFFVVIIADNMLEDEAYKFENSLIADCDKGSLATYTHGGMGTSGWKHTDEVRAQMSVRRLGVPLSKDHCKNLSDAIRNSSELMNKRKTYFIKSNPSKLDHVRLASSLRMKTKNPMISIHVRNRIAEKNRGRVLTQEHREKIATSLKGKTRGPMSDKVHAILKAVQHRRKRPVETTCGLKFESCLAAANALGIRQGNISNSCAGRQRAGGYQWKYSNPIPKQLG